MKKSLLTLAFSSLIFLSAFAQYENVYWKNVGSDNYVYASGGTASFYQGSITSSPTLVNTYTITNNVVTFGPNANLSCTGNGLYNLSIVRDTFSFALVSDACFLRSFLVNNTKWTRFFPLGVETNALSSQIKLYPNPASASFKIDMPANGSVSVYDSKGMHVMEKSLTVMTNTISTETFRKGIYYAQIMVDGNWIKTSTLVIE